MEVKISKALWEAHSKSLAEEPFDVEERGYRYHSHTYLDLSQLTMDECRQFRDLIANTRKGVRGQKTALRDTDIWIEANSNGGVGGIRARHTRVGKEVLTQYIKTSPRRRIFKVEEEGDDSAVLGYYVNSIEFHEAVKSRHGSTPEHLTVHLCYEKFGEEHTTSFTLWKESVVGRTSAEMLMDSGYMLESPQLHEDYEDYVGIYFDIKDNIGEQYWAAGIAEEVEAQTSYWWRSFNKTYRLDSNGPSKVVIDVPREGDEEDRRGGGRRNQQASNHYWTSHRNITAGEVSTEEDEDVQPLTEVQIPVHPYVTIFDLARHRRLHIHVQNLVKYRYKRKIREKLIIPEDHGKLIDTLTVEKDSNFADVIRGKSGGTIIICQGPPGTGKTLTAEIYAETLGRPLYTIQCSQLGTDPDTLEEQLMIVLARGRRWGAVTLLDEADVYVHERGSDLDQNAIVGVFLRVLEYHTGVLFLTTNRIDLVDDAILSRCTARVPYSIPSEDDQCKIWKVLSDENKAGLTEEDCENITAVHHDFSGRDIKNLLKLCMMVNRDSGRKIDADLVSEMRLFKPTVEAKER